MNTPALTPEQISTVLDGASNYVPKFPCPDSDAPAGAPLKSPSSGASAQVIQPPVAQPAGSHIQPSAGRQTENPWHKGEPPHDGQAYIAFGRILWEDDISAGVDPFTGVIRWTENPGQLAGWHDRASGLSVQRSLEDRVVVDYWLTLPEDLQ